MKKSKEIFSGLLSAIGGVCVLPAAGWAQSLPTNVGFTAGRTSATVIAVAGLVGVVIGGLALHSAGRIGARNGRAGAALSIGLIVIILSAVHLSRATGDFGTGSGRAGAIVALVLGLTAMILGVVTRVRSGRIRRDDTK